MGMQVTSTLNFQPLKGQTKTSKYKLIYHLMWNLHPTWISIAIAVSFSLRAVKNTHHPPSTRFCCDLPSSLGWHVWSAPFSTKTPSTIHSVTHRSMDLHSLKQLAPEKCWGNYFAFAFRPKNHGILWYFSFREGTYIIYIYIEGNKSL